MAAGPPEAPTIDETKGSGSGSKTERAREALRTRTPRDGARQRFLRGPLPARRRPESDVTTIREGEQNRLALRRDSYYRRALAGADVLAGVIAFAACVGSAGEAPTP